MPSTNKTPNIGLNQWLGNEYVKRQDFVDDNNIIDEEIGKIKKDMENMSTDAKGTSYDSSTSELDAKNVQDAIDKVNAKAEANKTSILELQTEINGVRESLISSCNQIIDIL